MSVFLIRAIVGIIGAFLLMRFFYPDAAIEYSVVLAAVLVGLAYLMEKARGGGRGSGGG
ncbi:MAG: hypothetical protein ACLFOY_04925 [Desulfatibacillaceae bacterium]